IAGAAVSLPAGSGVPAATRLWICEQGAELVRGGNQYQSGETLLAIPDDIDSGEFALVDLSTLDSSDISNNTLINAAAGTDTLIVTEPAFASTQEGDIIASPGPNGSSVVRRGRDGLADTITTLGRPFPLMERREVAAIDTAGAQGMIGSVPGRDRYHEAVPAQLGHPGMPAAEEIHGSAASLSGPIIPRLQALMRERIATDINECVSTAQAPLATIADPGGTTAWASILETLTHGISGDVSVRSFVAATSSFLPGQAWTDIKNAIELATGIDLDASIDSATLDDDTLATAMDQLILKTRDGARQFYTALTAAINRAEDFIYIETPAIDALSTGDSDEVDLIELLTTRLQNQAGLKLMLCVPEKYLPGQPSKLEEIRQSTIGAALKALKDSAADNVELFTPTAGPDRRLHMASTTVIVDDAVALTGTTHLWRRGLTFDASLSVALFDENVLDGRPAAINNARRQLLADRLGVDITLIANDFNDCFFAIQAHNNNGGLLRVEPDAYTAKDDATSPADLDIWNPDGTTAGISDWFLFLAGLGTDVEAEINNAIR
ncbi:MAG: hypothetical protein GY826_01055, partial [Fuerstiella sp.]|nr:hypothetical protein [Fuerstiella sp.]